MTKAIKIYRAPIVNALHTFYDDLCFPPSDDPIRVHLLNIATKMFEGVRRQENCVFTQINNYNPDYLGVSIDLLKNKELTLQDCQKTIANEFGFNSWKEVDALDDTMYNIQFEQCVNSVINGDLDVLENLIQHTPQLIKMHSQYGHKATLLHYTASNGVELWRQQVPQNLEEVVKLLIARGADKAAKMDVYGGDFTTHQLFTSSAHPYDVELGTSIAPLLSS